MVLSEDFPVCPWCGMENGVQLDAIDTLGCSECDRPFIVICRIEEMKIPRADKTGVYIHHQRHYETRKMMAEVLAW